MADTAADTAQLAETAPILLAKAFHEGFTHRDPAPGSHDCSPVPLDGKLASSQRSCIAGSLRVWIDVPNA